MNILLTGAFGNVGSHTLQELLRQGHTVRCFDICTPANEKKAKRIANKAEVIWGDLRNEQEVQAAVTGQELIIHLAFIIPPAVDKDLQKAEAVNVGGTKNMLKAAQSQPVPPKFFFASTFEVYGRTQHLAPPRKVTDPLEATDAYSQHKIECEQLVQSSGLQWTIFRFCDMSPLSPDARKPEPIMFEIPLEQRFEMLHPDDAALAIANGIQADVWEKIWQIGGGKSCQIRYKDYLNAIIDKMGVGRLPEEAFTKEAYTTDWVDSDESQALLQYQRHSFEEIIAELEKIADPGPVAHIIMPLIRPLVQHSILKMSPYIKKYTR